MRLVVFDRTDTGRLAVPRIERAADGTARGTGGLTRFWRIGASMHRAVRSARSTLGAASWREALTWAADEAQRRGEGIDELQAWGHGGWGYMGMGSERLDGASSARGGALDAEVSALAAALSPGALVWLRCCSAFGHDGRTFAERLSDRLGARVAGHTHIIGVWQSGTHSVAPGGRADWDPGEGVDAGLSAKLSTPTAPRTIHCLRLRLPPSW